MFSKKNNVIEELTMYSIPKATRTLSLATDIDKQRELMGCFVDPIVVQHLCDNDVKMLFSKIKDAVETKIRALIKENTGQVAVTEGRKVKLTHDFNGFNAGTEGVIKKCIRFEEDTFGQGWYTYDVEIPGGFPLLRMYRNEFEPI